MNIAFFHNLPSGGALRALYQKIEFFEKRGDQVSLYTFSTAESAFLQQPKVSGEKIEFDLLFSGIEKWRRYLRASRLCAECINSSDADVVYVDKCQFLSAPSVLRFLKKPAVLFLHEPLGVREYSCLAGERPFRAVSLAHSYFQLSLFNKLKKIVSIPERIWIKRQDRMNVKAAARVLTCSQFAKNWITRVYGVSADVAYQGINLDFFIPANQSAKKRQVLSVGRLEARKGHDFILRSLARVAAHLRPRLIIVCDAEQNSFVRRLQRDAQNSGVSLEIIRRPPQGVLRSLYQESAAVLCAGVYEPFGLVPLEAAACGALVIATDEGGYCETVLRKQTGLLLPRDEQVWAKNVECVISKPDIFAGYVQAGIENAKKNWSSKDWCDNLARVMETLI